MQGGLCSLKVVENALKINHHLFQLKSNRSHLVRNLIFGKLRLTIIDITAYVSILCSVASRLISKILNIFQRGDGRCYG